MAVDDIAESLGKLALEQKTVVRTDHGENYTVDPSTGDKYIKGSRRKDGSLRSDIKVKPGYIPPDEQAKYVPRFRRDPDIAKPADMQADKEKQAPREAKEVDPSGRNGVAKTRSAGMVTRAGRHRGSKSESQAMHSQETEGVDEAKHDDPKKGNSSDARKKLYKAIKNTKKKIKEAQDAMDSKGEGETHKESQMTSKIGALNEKLKRLESALNDLALIKPTDEPKA
ncbi:hypothetical protein BgAZ_101370 [Babesia gibsoni]|uniref:WIBG Mago-binding domain-containing protein n=1 Tax=Babesia gibsoni TaxID=33632 RepID=A0AAD8PF57_BABGI|nr:hypothetical protein BgAZ_101370 [Babesia gibsoni]